MKNCHTFEHTADVGLAASANSLEELFEALAEGLGNFICDRDTVEEKNSVEVSTESEDVEALAVDFLSQVLRVIQVEKLCLSRVSVGQIDENKVVATVYGEPYKPEKHEIAIEVKAVTYHQLEVRREGDIWIGRVILDI